MTMAEAVSLFAGIGGFELALQRAGVTTSVASEIERHCQEVLSRHFPQTELIPDVKDIRGLKADIVTGGFPCQDISIAGKRAGLAGERSGLWREYARILDEVRPRWCVIENVAGLLSSNKGRDLGVILGALGVMGYGFAYRVLDAQWFGVPQRRRRVFIVGCLGDDRRAAKVLFELDGGEWNPPTRRDPRQDVAGTLAARTNGGGYPGTDESCLNHVIAFNAKQDPIPVEDMTPAVSAQAQLGVSFNQRSEGRFRDVHASLSASKSATQFDGVAVEDKVRKLMPLECERLQGFPDGWTEGHADTQRYRMLGNAVAVPVVEWIARRLVALNG